MSRPAVVLPDDGPAHVGGVDLPSGRRLRASAAFDDRGAAVPPRTFWLTDGPVTGVGELWFELGRHVAESGLVPVLLEGSAADPARPWESGELIPADLTRLDALEDAAVLRQLWKRSVPATGEMIEFDELLAPYSAMFPGLALGEREELAADELRGVLALQPPARLGLVPCGRPADVVSYVGWPGGTNLFADPLPISAVLRSWEDRFGAVVLRAGFDTIDLVVTRPPRTPFNAVAVASEHFALCPDIVYQGEGSIQALADQIVGEPIWSFWWD